MTEFLHILDRFLIHFTAATSLGLMLAIGYRYAYKRTRSQWLPHSMPETLVYAGMTLFAVAILREAWDVGQGQSVIKAFCDYLSWLLGAGFGVWGLYRWHYFGWEG